MLPEVLSAAVAPPAPVLTGLYPPADDARGYGWCPAWVGAPLPLDAPLDVAKAADGLHVQVVRHVVPLPVVVLPGREFAVGAGVVRGRSQASSPDGVGHRLASTQLGSVGVHQGSLLWCHAPGGDSHAGVFSWYRLIYRTDGEMSWTG